MLGCCWLSPRPKTQPHRAKATAQAKSPTPQPPPRACRARSALAAIEAIRANNIGVALMDRHQFSGALGKFQTSCVMNPQSEISCLNAGIALLNMLRYDDAQKILGTYADHHPENPRVWFNLALLSSEPKPRPGA